MRGGYGRFGMLFGRPGRREFKEVNWRTDWLLPILQASVCVVVLFFDLVFAVSWMFILPPEWDWWLGVFIFIMFPPTLIILLSILGAYLWNKIAKKPFSWRAVKIAGYVAIGFAVGAIILVMVDVLACQNIWWSFCQDTYDLTLPIPHVERGSNAVALGFFILFIGIIAFLLHPGRYPLGLSVSAAIYTTLAQWIVPLRISITQERPIIIYMLYLAWCTAFVVGTATLLLRFWAREIPDQYIPEAVAPRRPIEEERFNPFDRSGRGDERGM